MAEFSKIDYLLPQHEGEEPGGTWSPWIGCDKGGRAGCAHCWAEAWARRNPRFRGHWGPDAPRYFFGDEHWQQPLRWQRKCERLGRRKRVLVSLCDPFEGLACDHPQWLEQGLANARMGRLIRQTPLLDWLVVTKRPENIPREALAELQLPNLWLGVSCWDQPSADRNIPLLLEVPAAVRWVSLEPLLGPVDLDPPRCDCWHPGGVPCDVHHDPGCQPWCVEHDSEAGTLDWLEQLDWVVVGCESRGARPGRRCDLTWVLGLDIVCARAQVPMFVKQLPDEQPGRLAKSAELARWGWPVQMPVPERAKEGQR